MLLAQPKRLIGIVVFIAMNLSSLGVRAQDDSSTSDRASAPTTGASAKTARRTATIHWQRVPLRDALGRLRALFDDKVFVDRRVDPNLRVSLDIDANSAEEVVTAIATEHGLGAAQLTKVVYLGPSAAADQLRAIATARSQQVARLPADVRGSLTKKQPTSWPRLSEPARVIESLVELRGWRLTNAETIPHDLWSAGQMPDLPLAEQLTVLLIGFDLTFTLHTNEHSIEIVPLQGQAKLPNADGTTKRTTARPRSAKAKNEAKQLYTLRVKEQPVGAVLKEFSKRLHWAIQIDEESIKAAGKSLDTRVSFSVENADQEHLLEALLHPAGLDFQLQGEQVRIVAGRYEKK